MCELNATIIKARAKAAAIRPRGHGALREHHELKRCRRAFSSPP